MNETDSKKSIEQIYEGSSSVKSKIILQAFHSLCNMPEEQPQGRSNSQLRTHNLKPRNMHFSPLFKNRSRRLESSKPSGKTMSSHTRTLKQFKKKREANDTLNIARSFFYTTLKFYSLAVVPSEFFEELAYVSQVVDKSKFPEKSKVQLLLNELASIPTAELPSDLRSSIEEFATSSHSPTLHNTEHKLNIGIASLTAKCISSLSKSPSYLFKSLLALLSAIDQTLIVSIEEEFCKNITGKVLSAVKELPKMIRENEIGVKYITKAKKLANLYERSGKNERNIRIGRNDYNFKLESFVKDVFRAIKLYKVFYAKAPKKNPSLASFTTESKLDDNRILDTSYETKEFRLLDYNHEQTNVHSSKACLLQQFLKGFPVKPVLNNSFTPENDYSYDGLLSTKDKRPATSLARRRPLKRNIKHK